MDILGKPLNPSKRLKEEFVSNLTGSSMLEIAALSAIVPALVVLRQWSSSSSSIVHSYARNAVTKKDDNVTARHKYWRTCTLELTVDFFCVILPLLVLFTVLAEWAYICAIVLILLLLLCISVKRLRYSNSHCKEDSQYLSPIRTSILSYRVSVVVMTCLCILAVDFKIFPRRYAKTETFGTGLEVEGCTPICRSASVPRFWSAHFYSRCRLSAHVRRGCSTRISHATFTCRLERQFKCVYFDRTWAVHIRLQSKCREGSWVPMVHVSEYGVHWNFFFTLAAVSILTSLINIHPKYCGLFGSLILVGYQTCLIYGLSDYLVSNERALDIISQNKEGLFSIFGYWGMYLIGVHLGYHIFFANELSKMTGSFQSARIRVWILSAFFWVLTVILDNHVERVSRRTCNLAYVTFVLAQNFEVLSVLMLSDFICAQKPLVLEEAFNQNLLGSFLLANVLTGLVNLCVDTLSTSPFAAFGLLFGYTFILSAAVGFAWFYGIKFKFW